MALFSTPIVADTFNSAERTSTHTIESEKLGETRTIIVRTPIGYDPTMQYAVVYLTDGEWSFELVASHLDYMTDNDVYPPLIVSGSINVNRNRDYVPRADKGFADTGQAGRYLEFVHDEWLPYMDEHYATSDNRVLLGHSFGGVFALHTLFTEGTLFDAYIALGASAWIADRVLFEEADAWFREPMNPDAFVYMAVGEGDGGPTVPSSQDLAVLFEEKAPDTLEWKFSITPQTDHFKNAVSGMNEAFMALFPAWGFAEELSAIAATGGATGVDRWFADKESSLGFRFVPAWFDLGVATYGMVQEGHTDGALATMQHLREHHPDNPHVASMSAWVFEKSGDLPEAAVEYARGIRIANEQGLHPNFIHLDRLHRGLARVTSEIEDGER